MLTPAEEKLVADGLRSSDHDYFFNSGIYGEPFVRDGLLCYFDGHAVDVCGVPLDAPVSDEELAFRVQRLLDAWTSEAHVACLNYCGPVAVDGPRSPAFECHYSEDPYPGNVDVFLDLTRPVLQGKEVFKALRRAEALGIVTSVCRRDHLAAEHLRLFHGLVQRADVGLDDVATLTSVGNILRHPATVLIEARQHDRLVGFCAAHKYFEATMLSVSAAFDRSVARSSDAVYGALLTHARDSGARQLGLGYAADENMLRYKSKWGVPIVGRPIFQRSWGCGPEEECVQWAWRLYQTVWRESKREAAAECS